MSDIPNPYIESFLSPKGPGDARPTALQIIRDNDLVGKWSDKVVLITGATSGIGIETARALHATGADVYITARNLSKAKEVVEDILGTSEGKGKLEVIEIDMNSLDSVKKAAAAFLGKSSTLNVLVNNAGVMITPAGSKTLDGFEQQFGVNHLAHFVLTVLLLPTLMKSSTPTFSSRVISLSSVSHRGSSVNFDDINFTKNYEPWTAYGQAKTANIWLANYIDRVYGSRGVHANSVFPGGIWTGLQENLPSEMKAMWESDPALSSAFSSAPQGAATTIFAAVSKHLEGKGGFYLHSCGVSSPAVDVAAMTDVGYAPHAFDEAGENRLWELSSELTGVKVEE